MKNVSITALVIATLGLVFAITTGGQEINGAIEIDPPYGDVGSDPTEETWHVAHYNRDCVGVGPMTCLLVRQDADDEWQTYFGNIANFAYAEGYSYQLRVLTVELTNVPADGSTRFVQLVEILSKTSVSPLVDREWYLETMADEVLPEENAITLTFASDGNLGGSGGCNRYFASYSVDENQLSIGVIGATQMACIDTIDTESAYLSALEQVSTYIIDETQLTLLNEEGKTILTFQSD